MSAQADESKLRAAHTAHPNAPAPAVALAELLIAAGRAAEAVAVTTPAARSLAADLNLWTVRGLALKMLSRFDEAIEAYRRGIQVSPRSGVAEHNLAGAFGDAERYPECEAATRRAFAKGLDAPETWLVHARALFGQGRIEEAIGACRQAIQRRPNYLDAHGDLAKMLWMQSEDAKTACTELDVAIQAHPETPLLRLKKAKLLESAGDLDGAYAALAPVLSAPGINPELHMAASQILVSSNPALALAHAERAFASSPRNPLAAATLCEANLAAGRADVAEEIALGLCEYAPHQQHSAALLATAWRILGDPRYGARYDYERLVKSWMIDTPPGWQSLNAFLADLQLSLERLHPLPGHPIGLSLRRGSQTLQGLDKSDDPVVRAFFYAIDRPIREHIAFLGAGTDVVRSRATGHYKFDGVWSAKLRADGFHTNHLHPRGWLSSACYIALPSAVERGKEGWLKFGEPGIPTSPRLGAEYYVKPQPGLLVMFPSYMWHGTVPFTGEESRLTIAFDVLPE
jgi:tetratricopeptide (TPR) repeat protein